MANEKAPEDKQFAIQRIFVKDMSFEAPNSPLIFNQKWEPKIEFNLSSNSHELSDELYEVAITTTVTVKIAEQTAYLAEVVQSGVFVVKGFSKKELGPMLGSFCPNVLFPYAREAVSDIIVKGGFPQMLLAPINFDALYAQHLQNVQKKQAPSSETIN